jgi:hypothetical protein
MPKNNTGVADLLRKLAGAWEEANSPDRQRLNSVSRSSTAYS